MIEGIEGLNSPLAIVAILSAIFGFLALALDKFFYFLRGVNKSTPMDKLAGSFEKIDGTLKSLNLNLSLLNKDLKNHVDMGKAQNEMILHEIREARRQIENSKYK